MPVDSIHPTGRNGGFTHYHHAHHLDCEASDICSANPASQLTGIKCPYSSLLCAMDRNMYQSLPGIARKCLTLRLEALSQRRPVGPFVTHIETELAAAQVRQQLRRHAVVA